MKRLIIVHGYEGTPNVNWFPWLKKQAEGIGFTVSVPQLPNTDAPHLSEWLPFLQNVVGEADEETYFAGHSLGCPTILRYLESLPEGQKIGGALLVAGFAEPIKFSELDSFVAGPWDDIKIKRSVNKITLINSDDDKHIPLEMGERMRDRFDAKLVVLHGAGHVTTKSGYSKAPVIFEQLKGLL